MTQFEQPYDASPAQPRKTSGLAITALVFSLVGIIPCLGLLTAPIGVILGLIGAATIGGKPHLKGTGFAVAAILIGLIFSVGQGYGAYWLYGKGKEVIEAMTGGPTDALSAGFAGDIAGFKDRFHGPGATASDAEAQAFIDELQNRYGDFVSITIQQDQSQPGFGQTTAVFTYDVEFSEATVPMDAELVMADQATGDLVMKWGYLEVRDPDRGDLRYPPESGNGGGNASEGDGDGNASEGDGGGGG